RFVSVVKIFRLLLRKEGVGSQFSLSTCNTFFANLSIKVEFKSTVLMIDPFPSEKPKDYTPDQQIFKVMQKTLKSFLEQMRAKPVHLTDALDTLKAGQFLIAPTRKITINGEEKSLAGDTAIACGALNGFSGFISKEFRIHDYFLGRFNCEMFLRYYFTVPAEAVEKNEIFKNGYAGVDKERFRGKDNTYQIIPIFTPEPQGDYFPIPVFSNGTSWPVIKEKQVEQFRGKIKKRVQALLLNAADLNSFNRFLLWLGTKVLLNRLITKFFMNKIKGSLRDHNLLK
ncbi:MAG: hypothetical protein M3040_10605, partial [Bacteroidota bacterium]|nr:hypothetical protein [Bacteroidota bacterium]